MAWIESHTVLIRHRKLKELARELRLRPAHAMGHLHALWHAALEQQEDGDLIGWSDEFLSESADYPGDALQFVRLLQTTGWLEGKLLHDWLDYAGMYLVKKYSTSNRGWLVEIWKKHGRAYGSEQKASLPNPPNLTIPNQPKDKTPLNPPLGGKNDVDQRKKEKRRAEEVIVHWQEMIEHMDKRWFVRKKAKFFWRPHYFKQLRTLCTLHRPYGVMALWDLYIDSDDTYAKNAGYSFEMFAAKIPTLVDSTLWKFLAKKHEEKLCGPDRTTELLESIKKPLLQVIKTEVA